MASVNRYVFDANAVISALLFPQSIPGQTFFGALERGQVLMSRDLAEELSEVLSRSKFDRYLTREERERLLVAVIDEAEFVHTATVVRACRDPDDDRILELALDGSAEYLVTGDKDLLVLDPFRHVRIVTPAQLLDLWTAEIRTTDPS
jgi:uncharacterized protein